MLCAGQHEAADWGSWRDGAFLCTSVNVFLDVFKTQLDTALCSLLWLWSWIQLQSWLYSEWGPGLSGPKVPSDQRCDPFEPVLSYDTALGPRPRYYQPRSPFPSNFNSSFTQIQKHTGISLSKFSMRVNFSLRVCFGTFSKTQKNLWPHDWLQHYILVPLYCRVYAAFNFNWIIQQCCKGSDFTCLLQI